MICQETCVYPHNPLRFVMRPLLGEGALGHFLLDSQERGSHFF